MARIRKDVWTILSTPGDLTLDWYAKGVAEMKKRKFAVSTSWRFQAAIHEYLTAADDPLNNAADPPPLLPVSTKYWKQCQHGSWYFLPWHRMYLHHFEQILLADIIRLGGPVDWALPYWDYTGAPATRILPQPFRQPANPATNPLFVAQREPLANAGSQYLNANDVSLKCLTEPIFEQTPTSASTGFGGPVTGPHHGAGTSGAIEKTPHGNVHSETGGIMANGKRGWMGGFHTAGLDPIFWLHHCNLDRLWEVWLQTPPHRNSVDPRWLTNQTFDFLDATGAPVTMKCRDVLATKPQPLDYEYDRVTPPTLPPAFGPLAPAVGRAPGDAAIADLLGASPSVTLAGAPARTELATQPGPMGLLSAPSPTDAKVSRRRRVFLHVEGLTSTGAAGTYDVYLGIPEGAAATEYPDRRVGSLPMFGLEEASRAEGGGPGPGLSYALNATAVVESLRRDGALDPKRLGVVFLPVARNAGAPVRVGRVSLYAE